MCYNIYDSEACSVKSCDRLEDALKLVSVNLEKEQQLGRFVDREPDGRWAVYDGLLVKVLWIETDEGVPVPCSLRFDAEKTTVA